MGEFTKKMHEAAEAEGWWLSTRDDGFYEIQRFDEDRLARFDNDTDALAWVKRQASGGSALHQLALRLDGTKA